MGKHQNSTHHLLRKYRLKLSSQQKTSPFILRHVSSKAPQVSLYLPFSFSPLTLSSPSARLPLSLSPPPDPFSPLFLYIYKYRDSIGSSFSFSDKIMVIEITQVYKLIRSNLKDRLGSVLFFTCSYQEEHRTSTGCGSTPCNRSSATARPPESPRTAGCSSRSGTGVPDPPRPSESTRISYYGSCTGTATTGSR